jgi:hypothetical protein
MLIYIKFDPSQFALPFVVEVICLVLKTIPQERLNHAKKVCNMLNFILGFYHLVNY